MLNISNNNLHSIAVLNACHALQSLDASGNSIQQIEDLSHLTLLKVNRKEIRNSILFLFNSI
jgi:Leucine-rich repeat (LRR) protein